MLKISLGDDMVVVLDIYVVFHCCKSVRVGYDELFA